MSALRLTQANEWASGIGLGGNYCKWDRPRRELLQVGSASAGATASGIGLGGSYCKWDRPRRELLQVGSASAGTTASGIGLGGSYCKRDRPRRELLQAGSASAGTAASGIGLGGNCCKWDRPARRALRRSPRSCALSYLFLEDQFVFYDEALALVAEVRARVQARQGRRSGGRAREGEGVGKGAGEPRTFGARRSRPRPRRSVLRGAGAAAARRGDHRDGQRHGVHEDGTAAPARTQTNKQTRAHASKRTEPKRNGRRPNSCRPRRSGAAGRRACRSV